MGAAEKAKVTIKVWGFLILKEQICSDSSSVKILFSLRQVFLQVDTLVITQFGKTKHKLKMRVSPVTSSAALHLPYSPSPSSPPAAPRFGGVPTRNIPQFDRSSGSPRTQRQH